MLVPGWLRGRRGQRACLYQERIATLATRLLLPAGVLHLPASRAARRSSRWPRSFSRYGSDPSEAGQSGCPGLLRRLQAGDHGARAPVSPDLHALFREEERLRDLRSRGRPDESRSASRPTWASPHSATCLFDEHAGQAAYEWRSSKFSAESSEAIRQTLLAGVKRWSDLHGDMES